MKGLIRKYIRLSVVAAAFGSVISGGFQSASAESGAGVDERLEAIDQKVRILERKWELEQESAAAKAKSAAVVGAGKDGFYIKSSDGAYQLKIGGYIHADGRFYVDDSGSTATDAFLLRRVRLNIEGTLAKDFDFRILPDFGEGKAVLQDGYIGYKYSPGARIRVGKFKGPFGLERLQSGTALLFVERALPTNLVPNRDLGVQLHGDLLDGTVSYAVGIFNGVTDGGSSDSDNNDGKDVTGRLFVHPFKKTDVELLEGLGLGVAASQGERSGNGTTSNLPSYKTAGQQTFFSYKSGVVANGALTRYSPQAYYYFSSLGLLGEYVSSTQKVQLNGSGKDIANTAWQATASFVLTGEKASYSGVKPKGKLGALELVGRYNELNIDTEAFSTYADPAKSAKSAKGTGLGFNWYVNDRIKVSADYEQTRFDGGAAGGKDRDDEKVILSRVQAVF